MKVPPWLPCTKRKFHAVALLPQREFSFSVRRNTGAPLDVQHGNGDVAYPQRRFRRPRMSSLSLLSLSLSRQWTPTFFLVPALHECLAGDRVQNGSTIRIFPRESYLRLAVCLVLRLHTGASRLLLLECWCFLLGNVSVMMCNGTCHDRLHENVLKGFATTRGRTLHSRRS